MTQLIACMETNQDSDYYAWLNLSEQYTSNQINGFGLLGLFWLLVPIQYKNKQTYSKQN